MKFLVLKKSILKAIVVLLVVSVFLAINIFGQPSAVVYFGQVPRLVPIYGVDTTEKQIAITFDSAWGADKTLGILDLLKKYDAKATFFLVGFWVDKYPDMVKAIHEQGIEIGTHSNTHPDFVNLSEEQMKLELTTSIDKIEDITGSKVQLFRAPYGSYNNTMINLADNLNLKTIQWTIDTLDWKGLSGGDMVNRVMNKVNNGAIILCHNNSDNILEGLELILNRLTTSGYKFVSVGDLIIKDNYYIDNLGIQRKK